MFLNEMINLLKEDLKNEYKHMLFYLQSSYLIKGLHQLELEEFLTDQAKNEMNHVKEFANLIIGLGGEPDEFVFVDSLPKFSEAKNILEYALQLEEDVVKNYCLRIMQASTMQHNLSDGKYIECFLEDQILHSREDADHIKKLLNKK